MKNKFKLLILIFLGLPLASYAQTHLTAMRAEDAGTATRIVFIFDQPVQSRVFTLSNPNRIVVDLTDTQLRINLKQIQIPNSDIKNIRSGFPAKTITRLVFDTVQAMQFKVSKPDDKQLILEIYSAAKENSEKNSEKISEKTFPKETKQNLAAITPPTRKPAKPIPQKIAPQTILSRTTVVVIDAGHGGKDPGTVGTMGTREKDVVLAIALRLANLINRQVNMRAVLTRNGDYFVPLRDRIRLARKDKADLFIAIHADSYFNNHSSGVSVFALSQHGATSEAARWLAKRENYSELGGVDLGELGDKSYLLRSVLIDLAQTATITDSLHLGSSLLDSLSSVAKLHYPRVEQAPFVVLKSPDIPSVLIETGFLSNPREEIKLQNKKYQDEVAQALFNGIYRYLKKNSSV